MEKVIQFEETKKVEEEIKTETKEEMKEKIDKIDEELTENLERLQQEETYIRHQSLQTLETYVTRMSEASISETIIDVLVSAGLVKRDDFENRTKLYVVNKLKELIQGIEEDDRKMREEFDNINVEEITDEERVKVETEVRLKVLSAEIIIKESKGLLERMEELIKK